MTLNKGGNMNLSEQDLQEENKHLELTINLLRKNISELAQDLYVNLPDTLSVSSMHWVHNN